MAAALAGFALGLSLIVAIGAQNAFVLRQGLRREHVGAGRHRLTHLDHHATHRQSQPEDPVGGAFVAEIHDLWSRRLESEELPGDGGDLVGHPNRACCTAHLDGAPNSCRELHRLGRPLRLEACGRRGSPRDL